MWTDPIVKEIRIVEEIRRQREAYAAKFNYDLEAIVKDIRRQELESGREVVTSPLKRYATKIEEAMKDEYDFSSAKRGPVTPLPLHQTEIKLRLDNEVLDWLRKYANEASGGSYQDMINVILRAHIDAQEDAALIRAIKESEGKGIVSREEVFTILRGTA